jgi:diketogulonate reductase-like aldo/keto reductase
VDFLKEQGGKVKREDLFICTKVWNHLHEPDEGTYRCDYERT